MREVGGGEGALHSAGVGHTQEAGMQRGQEHEELG